MYLEKKKHNVTIPSFVFPVFCWVYYCCGVSYRCLSLCCSVGAVSVISPLELVRTKMQSRKLPYSELMMCIRSAVAQDGWFSLWRGWGPTVLRDVPFSGQWTVHSGGMMVNWCSPDAVFDCFCVFPSALYWFNYELVKAQLCERYRAPQTSFTISFTAGAISGAVSILPIARYDCWLLLYFKWHFKIRNSVVN